MRFNCFFASKSDERRSLLITLSSRECRSVVRLRKRLGAELADVTAAAIALSHAYAELDGREWFHVSPPEEVRLS